MNNKRFRNGIVIVAVLVTALFLLPVTAVFAVDATVTDVQGTAQFRVPGGGWTQLQPQSVLPNAAEIVTSVRSNVTIEVGSNTVVVGGLSRVIVSELVEDAGTLRTRLDLPYGRLSADVRRGGTRGNDFSVATPIATAAVRGTEFEFSGYQLSVAHGDVELANRIGQTHSVRGGQLSRAYGVQGIQSVEETLRERTVLRGD